MERANTTILTQPRGIYIKYDEKCHINVFDRTSEGSVDVHLYPLFGMPKLPLNQHSSTAEKYPLLTFPLIKLDILPIFLIIL